MTLSEELSPDLASIDATLAQVKRCIEDNDPEDASRWAGILESKVSDLRRDALIAWEEA